MSLIKCPECTREVSSQADGCPYCGFPVREHSMVSTIAQIGEFTKLNDAWPTIFELTAMMILIVTIAAGCLFSMRLLEVSDLLEARGAQRLIFAEYFCLFVSMWTVYFLTGREDFQKWHFRSLRRLLKNFSGNYPDAVGSGEEAERFRKSSVSPVRNASDLFYDKARSTVVTTSIMSAASLLLIAQGLGPLASLIDGGNSVRSWVVFALAASSLSGVTAFGCFLVSVDALDSIFNDFPKELNRYFVTHFYRLTVGPRYIGFVSLMTSLIFLFAARLPLVACSVIAVFVWAGHRYWFPREIEGVASGPDCPESFTPWLRRSILVAPLFLQLGLFLGILPGVVPVVVAWIIAAVAFVYLFFRTWLH